MASLLLAARLAVAALFASAAILKLRDLRAGREALTEFGVPARLAPAGSIALPLLELAVAAALVSHAGAWWGAAGAIGLLAVFSAAVAVNLARGSHPDCHCFGAVSARPISGRTLARNGLLGAPAVLVLVAGRQDAGASLGGFLAAHSGEEIAIAVLAAALAATVYAAGYFILGLLRQQGRLLVRIERLEKGRSLHAPASDAVPAPAPTGGLAVGTRAPPFALRDLDGETVALPTTNGASAKPLLLLFSEPGCGACMSLLPEVGRWQAELAGRLDLVVVSRGTLDANRSKASEFGLGRVLLQADREVAEAYAIAGTPSAVLVRQGVVVEPSAAGQQAIEALVHRAIAPAAPSLAPAPSSTPERLPPFTLTDLDGVAVSDQTLIGAERLLLFWNPGCGYCQAISAAVLEAERQLSEGTLVVVSSGAEAASRTMGFSSQVLLDPGFTLGRALQAAGTPSAVEIAADGKITAEPAVGAPAVSALVEAYAQRVPAALA